MNKIITKIYPMMLKDDISKTGIEDIDKPLNSLYEIVINLLRAGGIIFFVISLVMFLLALGDQDAHGKKTWGLCMLGGIAAASIGQIVKVIFG